MITLYSHPTGPLIQYGGKIIFIEDLNPELKTRWRMSRWEMFRLGFRCIAAAFRPSAEPQPQAGCGGLMAGKVFGDKNAISIAQTSGQQNRTDR